MAGVGKVERPPPSTRKATDRAPKGGERRAACAASVIVAGAVDEPDRVEQGELKHSAVHGLPRRPTPAAFERSNEAADTVSKLVVGVIFDEYGVELEVGRQAVVRVACWQGVGVQAEAVECTRDPAEQLIEADRTAWPPPVALLVVELDPPVPV